MNRPRFVTLVAMIMLAALSRVLYHPWNATPVAAMALFAGANFTDRKSAFFVPLAAMFISDIVLGFYPLVFLTYLCFAATVLIGRSLQRKRTVVRTGLACVSASVLFFVVTNFGCWLTMAEYTKDLHGLAQCYALALPFFRNTFIGDLGFTAVLFGSFALSEKAFPQLRPTSPVA